MHSTSRHRTDALDEASGILRLVESLNAVEDLQELLDRLAEAAATTAGWNVAVLSVYLPEGALLGGFNLPDAERARFLEAMVTTPLERRLAKRKQIRSFAFPDTAIAYVPHDADLARSAAFSQSDPRHTGSWHAEDRLFVLVRTGTGQEIGVLSLDEPLDGNAPSADTLGPLRVVERLLELGASFLYSRVLARDLRRSEEAYRALVDGAPVGIYRRDASERVRSCNPRLAEIYGYASPDALMADAGFSDLCDATDREAIHRALAASGEVRNFDMKARRLDGTAIRLRMAVRLDRDGQIQGIVEDVTEAKRLEEHLQRAQRIEAVGTLASGVAHDFNNLLAGILGYASLLDQRLGAEPALGAMARAIQEAALRAADLTRGLLGIARPPSGEPTRVDAGSVLADVARIAHETFDRRITTTVVVEGTVPPALVIAGELHRAILNLCINARDAMPDGGAITLTAVADRTGPREPPSGSHAGPWVRIDVRDTGLGMDESVKARLFEPFFTTKPRGKGTGLGLYGVYQFVTASSGAVDVESHPGGGTCFHVFVPAASAIDAADEKPPPPTTARTGPSGPGACILLIEDEDAIRRFAGTILREAGHVVVEVVDGEEAVRVFAADPGRFDLLLLDLMLPRLSGREVLLRCRAIRSDVPILLSSGNVRDGLDDPRVRSAIQGVLPKPYLPALLVERVRAVLGRRA
jgi:two-component system, cell cycle sensor histidine kinase and response regulator CckA